MHHFSFEEICSGKHLTHGKSHEYYQSSIKDRFEIAYNDTEKIINSSAFRRLQGKTQVYPFPETDSVRNRLTHSIEVAHIGQAIASRVMENAATTDLIKHTIRQLVSNGCLLHDIGNPPFGHSGEESIREYFNENESILIIQDAFKIEEHASNFKMFDGNAQGFRIATTLNGRKYDGGLRLSAATLSAMIKYPYSSSDSKGKRGKFGFMASERDYFLKVFKECGLVGADGTVYRSPLSIIVEAADDIAYLTADLQDAFVYGDLDYKFVKRELDAIAGDTYNFQEIEDEIKDERDIISILRSAAVNKMITVASKNIYSSYFTRKTPVDRYAPLQIWSSEGSSDIAYSEERIRDKSNAKIYRGRKKMTLQVAGGRIIKFVLDTQIRALNELYVAFMNSPRSLESVDQVVHEKIVGVISEEKYAAYLVDQIEKLTSRQASQVILRMPDETLDQIRHQLILALKRPESVASSSDPELAYNLIQISVDFVSGTTDRYISSYSRDWAGPTLT